MKETIYHPIPGELFHVHTWRCKHAGEEQDAAYVEKAIELGASRIVFTDHAPFPGNPFGHRMDIEQLPEYVESLNRLKAHYEGKIELVKGLEIEYLPSFLSYYQELQASGDIDILMIGQHIFEHEPGVYSFSDADKSLEYVGLCKAMASGIATGLFQAVAHPDRAFRRCKQFEEEQKRAALEVIEAAVQRGIPLEINYSSQLRKRNFWAPFWDLVPKEAIIVYGADAHSTEELEEAYNAFREKQIASLQ